MTPLLEVRNLSKAFGKVQAVSDVSLTVASGEIVALIGPNGAGKSTTFAMLGGEIAPDQGKILLDGVNVAGGTAQTLWRRGVGRTFQVAQTFGTLTVLENVELALASADGQIFHFWKDVRRRYRDAALALLNDAELAGHEHVACSTLAYGDVKRVELALALSNAPRLLLMDEPTAGMPADERNAFMKSVRHRVTTSNVGVLLTEHSLDVVFAFADRIDVLVAGRIVASGDAASIRANPDVQRDYLGHGPVRRRAV